METVALCLFPPFSFGNIRHKILLTGMVGEIVPEEKTPVGIVIFRHPGQRTWNSDFIHRKQ